MIALCVAVSLGAQEVRTYSGYNNNLLNKDWGAAHTVMPRVSSVNYEDGMQQENDAHLPEPRNISNLLFDQSDFIFDSKSLSDYTWAFGQFLDHDISLVDNNPQEPVFITIPDGDEFFIPGSAIITARSAHIAGTGSSVDNPRQYANGISSFIDASAVYGIDQERADWLRTFEGGKLKTSTGNLLPWNTVTGEFNDIVDLINTPFMGDDTRQNLKLFVAGDIRANENPLLLAMHTVFVREHNRLCDQFAEEHPSWSDEVLYQNARKMIGAYLQKITFEDWLPSMGVYLPEYNGYIDQMNPGIFNVFSAAAFRIGHTMINSDLIRMANNGQELSTGSIKLKDAFFNPMVVVLSGGIDPFFKGMGTQIMQEMDCKIIDDLRNFLFGSPGAGGLDLASINIYRGRDRGIGSYNDLRNDFGLPKVKKFEDFTANPHDVEILQELYGDVNNVDAWVGMLSEKHLNGAIFGPLVMTIIEKQFQVLRDGDRFYFENDPAFNSEDIDEIKNTSLHDIIMRNTDIELMQKDVFSAMPHSDIPNGPEIVEINLESVAYPNPTFDKATIKIYADYAHTVSMKCFNYDGKLISEKTESLVEGENFIDFNFDPLCPRGLYNVLIESGNSYSVVKLIKE
ncbi:MAG: T9SS type A sorting domain-containing protein [Bacteroidia bacterium]|nr:T9SS type A sorting domain-containing protein [Bacteroidia bacterium]